MVFKAAFFQAGVINAVGSFKRAVAQSIGDDILGLFFGIAKRAQRSRNRAVDDFKMTAARKFLKLDQGEIGFNAGCVTIHEQADCARRCDDAELSISKACLCAHFLRFFPERNCALT